MNVYKILKKPFFGRFMVQWKNPLAPEAQQHWELMQVPSKSGGTLVGWFRKTDRVVPKATIVLGHPMGKEAKAYFLKNGYTDLLLGHGYNVVIFDINGFGESTHGNFSYFEDVVAIGQRAKAWTPELPIGYHGISLGGQWATIAFADHTHCYNFAIVESAAVTLEDFWIHYPVAYKTLKICYALLPKYRRTIRMIDRIQEAQGLKSILFIYSLTDPWTPASMGQQFHEKCAVPSEFWTVPEAEHAMMMKSAHREAYQQKIIDYFDRMQHQLKSSKLI